MSENLLVEAALENVEAVIDALTANEVLREIPVVGTAFKVLKGAREIRDRIFAAKLLRFVQDLDSVPTTTRERLRQRMAENPDDAREVGETALIVIERASAVEKAHLIAVLFLAYVGGQIGAPEFRRLASVVDQAFLDDLLEFLRRDKIPALSEDLFMQCLAPTGLTTAVSGPTWIRNPPELHYKVTPLGDNMRKACAYGRSLLKPESGG